MRAGKARLVPEEEDAPKPEKKHILIKRKKEEVEPASVDGEFPTLETDFIPDDVSEAVQETSSSSVGNVVCPDKAVNAFLTSSSPNVLL